MRYVRVCDTMLHSNTLLQRNKSLFKKNLIKKECAEEWEEEAIPDRIIVRVTEKKNYLIQSSRYVLFQFCFHKTSRHGAF